jgi:predicted glutamine amidotransferase
MCLIIVKPAGVEMPEKNILQCAADLNPHGFGFCTAKRRYRSLIRTSFLNEVSKVTTCEAAIIHFRLATTGSIKRANCHPFRYKDVYFAHNGVLHVETQKDMTDSETFFRQNVMTVVNEYGYGSLGLNLYMKNVAYQENSRFAIMCKEDILMYGSFENHKGCYYSNTRLFYHNDSY